MFLKCCLISRYIGEGEGEVAFFSAKRWDRRNRADLIESATPCHGAQVVGPYRDSNPLTLQISALRLTTGCNVRRLHHCATTPHTNLGIFFGHDILVEILFSSHFSLMLSALRPCFVATDLAAICFESKWYSLFSTSVTAEVTKIPDRQNKGSLEIWANGKGSKQNEVERSSSLTFRQIPNSIDFLMVFHLAINRKYGGKMRRCLLKIWACDLRSFLEEPRVEYSRFHF